MQTAIRAIYPPECLGCGAPSQTEQALCGSCWRDCRFLSDPICDRCSVPLPGEGSESGILCDVCLTTARGWSRGRAAVLYSGTGRRIALALKHGDRQDLARPAATWMASVAPKQSPDALVLAVPLHWTRFVRRRFNQASLLAGHISRSLDLSFCPDGLTRTRRTPNLDGKTREERFDTLSRAIETHPRLASKLLDRDVLLVDDVMTSGATLSACADACISKGARNVDVLVLARVAKDT